MNRRIEAIALAGLIAVGCARPADATPNSTPVPTRNFPEFTLAPIPTPTLTPRPTEKTVIEGWPRARSTIYPYEISYPIGWTKTVNNTIDPPIDMYTSLNRVDRYQANVSILSESVTSWTRLTDYAKIIQDRLTQNIYAVREARKIVGPPVTAVNTKIAGQEAVIFDGIMPAFFTDPEVEIVTAVFMADGKAWQIGLVSATAASSTEKQKFNSMISSFSFIK